MVTLQHHRTGVGSCLLWLIVLLIVPCSARPLPVAAQVNVLDVARIDAFVRDQVQRHGIPGLALALVDGDQIVGLQGFGTADQSGRPVTPQTPLAHV
jgi:CubicO group peptidase (beta-lactamase class C family)